MWSRTFRMIFRRSLGHAQVQTVRNAIFDEIFTRQYQEHVTMPLEGSYFSFFSIPMPPSPTRVATIWLECSVAMHHALRINLRLEPFFMSREKKEVLQLGRLGAAMREIVVRVTRCLSQIRILASGETEFSMVLDIYQYTLQDRSGPAHFDDFNCLRE